MADDVRIPRSRGVLTGLALVALGVWGAIAPFAAPSLRFGYTPDHAWQYTSGRLYLSAVPGAVAALAGIVVLATRSRWFGGLCAFIAALAGVWFIAGAGLITLFPASLGVASVSTGRPILTSASGAALTQFGLFTGVGAAIVFFAALALGRFSLTAHRDYLRADAEAEAEAAYQAEPDQAALDSYAGAGYLPGQSPYPPQYPSADPYGETQDMLTPPQDPGTSG